MIDRRAFLSGSGAIVATLAAWPARGAASARRTSAAAPSPSIALVDRHLGGSESFAADARAQGLGVAEFSGDLAGVWMRELEPCLRAGPLTIVGYTSAATLFCLDLLARDYGARTVRRADRGAAVSFIVSSSPGRRAAHAPAAVRAQWRELNA